MKKYNLKIGLPVCSLIALLIPLPRLIHLQNMFLFIQIILVYLVFSLIAWVGSQYFVNTPFFKRTPSAGKLLFLGAILYGILTAQLFDAIIGWLGIDILSPVAAPYFPSLVIRGTIANCLMAFLVFHQYQMHEKEQSQLELERLKQVQLQTNLALLKEQLSPHFLFNSFNTLTTLTQEQNVIDYVEEMANVYRYLLSHTHSNFVRLSDELAFTESYLYILKTRLEKAIDVDIRINAPLMNRKIPPLTLQLLVENAVKHNITSSARPLHISIQSVGDQLVVRNTLQPKSSVRHSSGIGLTNMVQQYQLLFSQDIQIDSGAGMFTVTLPLPV